MNPTSPKGYEGASDLPTLQNTAFAGTRPRLGVEEVPTSVNPVVSEVPPAMDLSTSVETIPPIPHTEFDKPPEPEKMPEEKVQAPFVTPGPPPINTPPVSSSSLPPNGHNVVGKTHPVRKLLFLIPAVLLVATIFFVARFTGPKYVVREPEVVVTPVPIEEPILPSPTPAPVKTKSYRNENLLISLEIPEDYEVLSENDSSTTFGKGNTQILIVSRNVDTDYDEKEVEKIIIGGKAAVKFSNIRYVTEEPNYQFSLFPTNPEEEKDIEKILDSVVFLVDTSDWETFENTTFSYLLKYPPEWTETTSVNKDGVYSAKTEISKNPDDKSLNTLVIQTSSNVENAALTASEIISSTRTLSGWSSPPKIILQKLGGGDAQVIQGELTGKWRAYVVVWYKNIVIQMTWDDEPTRPNQQIFENMLSSFEFTI